MIYVNENTLKEMFERTYEAGWRGSLDLKEDYVATLMKEVASVSKPSYDASGFFTTTAGGGSIGLGNITISAGSF